ncbi:amino acid ABC transporter permease [Desulfovibrio litoralis]|nr:amino acid ABC transporter permease [Desulfovibrio litoralis]
MIYHELLPTLTRGLLKSVLIIVPSAVLGLILGVALGTARVFGSPWLRAFCNAYTAVFRGVPLVVQLFIFYFGLTNLSFLIHMFNGTPIGDYFASRGITHFGIYLEPYQAAILCFVLCSGAYHSEYIRGALISIKQGQIKAAEALGFSKLATIWNIVIPQAFRRALPGCGNEIIYLIKYSSLAYLLTYMELTGEAKNFAARTYYFTEVFLITGIYYLLLVTIAGIILEYLEKRLYIPGFGVNK